MVLDQVLISDGWVKELGLRPGVGEQRAGAEAGPQSPCRRMCPLIFRQDFHRGGTETQRLASPSLAI